MAKQSIVILGWTVKYTKKKKGINPFILWHQIFRPQVAKHRTRGRSHYSPSPSSVLVKRTFLTRPAQWVQQRVCGQNDCENVLSQKEQTLLSITASRPLLGATRQHSQRVQRAFLGLDKRAGVWNYVTQHYPVQRLRIQAAISPLHHISSRHNVQLRTCTTSYACRRETIIHCRESMNCFF